MKIHPKTAKLYVCGTAWGWEIDPTNHRYLEFYTTKEAALDDQGCTAECGVVEVEARAVRWVVPRVMPKSISRAAARARAVRQVRHEQLFIPLAERLLKVARERCNEAEVYSAFVWALGGLRRERARKRRLARERKAKRRSRR